MKKVRNTKEQILDTALNLFSCRGYSAVSIRDIGNVVGIKESTIYYHFENKRDIFQELLKRVEEITNAKPEKFINELLKITRVEEEAFITVGLGFLTNYLLEEKILKFIRMLMIEQHVNEEAADLYKQILFEAPLKHNAVVFKMLIEMGHFKDADINCLAMEYYAPIFFIFQRYFVSGEVTPERLEKAEKELKVNLRNFYRKYNIS
jgi:AcrR family transcriptional regulator